MLRGKPPFREILHYVQNDTCHVEHKRNIPWKGKTCGLDITVACTPRKTTLPGVCSPVEAGEVARIACRRGGDLPRGLHYVQNDTYIK